MSCLEYKIFHSSASAIEVALQELLTQSDRIALTPVRLVFFSHITCNKEYSKQRAAIEAFCKKHYNDSAPMLALIAQAPLESAFALEATYANDKRVKISRHENYITLDDKLLLSGAIYSTTNNSIAEQSDKIFTSLGEMLSSEGYSINNIVRQWNFIEDITHLSPEGQNYQQFNDSRSRFYALVEWPNGYPAATGIGTACGGVTVIVDVLRDSNQYSWPIDNPLQISAHAYSQRVLINNQDQPNKSTPKFERARLVRWNDADMIYISGTAAIRGEDSCQQSNIEQQTNLTMENIKYLISQKNLPYEIVPSKGEFENSLLRIYLKHRFNWPEVKQWISDYCKGITTLCVEADICRSELLVEIEGIANKNS